MASVSSQQGVFALRTQTAPGVFAADLATAGVAMRRTGGSMTGARELMIPDPEIGGNRDVPDALQGPISYSGDIEFYARFTSIGTLLKAALGAPVSVLATGVNTHTFTPSDAALLPYLSVYERVGANLTRANFTDAVVNTLELSVDPDGYLTGTAGMIAISGLYGVPDVDVSAITDETTMTVGTNVQVLYDGVNIKPKSLSISIANNYEDDDNRLGQFEIASLTPKRREVTGSFTLRHETDALMRQSLLGSSVATQAGGLVTKKPLVINISTYVDIPGATGTKYSLQITLPNVMYEPFGFEPSADDMVETDVNFQAVRPSNATPIGTWVLKNGTTALA